MERKSDAVTLSDDARALGVVAKVFGKEREVSVLSQSVEGDSEKVERLVREHTPDKVECEKAEALVNRARAALKKYGTNVELLGFIAGAHNAERFADEQRAIAREIELHNAGARFHRVKVRWAVLPIGRILDESTQAALCEKTTEALRALAVAVRAGDIQGVAYWIQRNRNVAGLMPALIARAVQDAVDDATRQLKELRELVNDGHEEPSAAGAKIDCTLLDVALGLVLAQSSSP